MSTRDLNEIIMECRQKGIFIKFDAYGMTVEKIVSDRARKCRIIAEAFEDNCAVISLQSLIDVAVKKIEEEEE